MKTWNNRPMFDRETVLNILGIADKSEYRNLENGFMFIANGFVLPANPHQGEVVMYYGDWDMEALAHSILGDRLNHDHAWVWNSFVKPLPGYYQVQLPVFNSNCKSWMEQAADLIPMEPISSWHAPSDTSRGDMGWQLCPSIIGVTAALVLRASGLQSPLSRCDKIRMAEWHTDYQYGRICITEYEKGKVLFSGDSQGRERSVWSAAVRRCG